MKKNNSILLPPGFHDILPLYAELESKTISKLLKNFKKFDYEQVKPPLLDFEDNFLVGNKKSNMTNHNAFRVMDHETGKIMILRTDFTMQIARIAAIRLKNDQRPLRLSYAGNVLRLKSHGFHTERERSQTGVELIGDPSLEADKEVILIAIDSLKKLGLSDISIDFNLPQLSSLICDEFGINENIKIHLLNLIEKKDIHGIKNLINNSDSAKIITRLIATSGKAEYFLERLSTLSFPDKIGKYFASLQSLVALLKKENIEIPITLDPLERSGFEYHTGISFSIFSTKTQEELGRGGRYMISLSNEEAVGFTLEVNAVLRVLKNKE